MQRLLHAPRSESSIHILSYPVKAGAQYSVTLQFRSEENRGDTADKEAAILVFGFQDIGGSTVRAPESLKRTDSGDACIYLDARHLAEFELDIDIPEQAVVMTLELKPCQHRQCTVKIINVTQKNQGQGLSQPLVGEAGSAIPNALSARSLPGKGPAAGIEMNVATSLMLAAQVLCRLGREPSAAVLIRHCLEAVQDLSKMPPLPANGARNFTSLLASVALESRDIQQVRAWLGLRDPSAVLAARGFRDAEFLLWADINLNVVDGSSAWMVSMARILGRIGPTVVLSKTTITRPQVVAPLLGDERITLLQPGDFDESGLGLDNISAAHVIAAIDDSSPRLRAVVARGSAAVSALTADRRFQHRLIPYLTDIYEHDENGGVRVRDGVVARVDPALRQCRLALYQTPVLRDFVQDMTGLKPDHILLPPPLGDIDINALAEVPAPDEVIRIGYAGKIAPDWGIDELLEQTEICIGRGLKIELHVYGDKISTGGSASESNLYRSEMLKRLDRPWIHRHGALPRAEVMTQMAAMDFAWCWRPEHFEGATLELSSKLVEGVAAGQRCICWPSATNLALLGASYPFLMREADELATMLAKRHIVPSPDLAVQIQQDFAIETLADRLAKALGPVQPAGKSLAILTHDPKFIFPWYSRLKAEGKPVVMDRGWEWGAPKDTERSQQVLAAADVVFCEWGLGNAIWASENVPEGKSLVVRLHAQEVRQPAARLAKAIRKEKVSRFVFVSERVRRAAISQYGWDAERCVVVPNYLQDDEYPAHMPHESSRLILGMVGIVPLTKRPDRALGLLAELVERGVDAELRIKGPRPADLPFMHGPSRRAELARYEEIFAHFERKPELAGRVHFEPWGNDVARFNAGLDVILSPSDSESFHYALADGVLSGAFPVVWNWPSAEEVYPAEWIVSEDQAVARVLEWRNMDIESRAALCLKNRDWLCEKYGYREIYPRLSTAVGLFD